MKIFKINWSFVAEIRSRCRKKALQTAARKPTAGRSQVTYHDQLLQKNIQGSGKPDTEIEKSRMWTPRIATFLIIQMRCHAKACMIQRERLTNHIGSLAKKQWMWCLIQIPKCQEIADEPKEAGQILISWRTCSLCLSIKNKNVCWLSQSRPFSEQVLIFVWIITPWAALPLA